jgi:neurotransmitter:Na+ symporter, NSS family
MGGFGNIIGAIWFFMLFLAAITSSISMYQPALAFFREALGIGRKGGVALVVGICGVGSFLTMFYSKDGTFLGTLDNWVGTFFIVVLALVQMIIFSWIFGVDRAMKEGHEGAEMDIPRFYRPIMKYVSPLYLLIIFIAFSIANLGDWIRAVMADRVALLAMALIAAVTIMLLVMVRIGEKRWRAAGIDINDDNPVTYGETR